ncbi:MAG: hypothetical protein Ct9H90mP24_1920 [Methanobacteriota archaeon]|nr:MAG: hypothetical protein Ct9H90mP24_1920 [Euryarchaeota archaeon]
MKFRAALLVNLGAIPAWFWLIPPFQFFRTSPFTTQSRASTGKSQRWAPLSQRQAFGSIIRKPLQKGRSSEGVSFGGVQDGPDIHWFFGDITQAFSGEQGGEYVEGKGWYEWPLYHIPIFMAISLVAITVIFVLGGYPALPFVDFLSRTAVDHFPSWCHRG